MLRVRGRVVAGVGGRAVGKGVFETLKAVANDVLTDLKKFG